MTPKRQSYRNLKPLHEARDIFLTRFRNLALQAETVPVRRALGRMSVSAVKAARSVPAYHAAAVDGVAVRAASTFAAFPKPRPAPGGNGAIPVNTGQPLPKGPTRWS